MLNKLRNIAIIAHVDHGKTTLVDQLLKQSQTLDARAQLAERAMDSNEQERERGITILAKNTAIQWHDYRINIVDTPGHADFGGEVERILSMVDSVLLLVDAVDGPMPQTRFVTQKAFAHGLKPIVVVNKIDRPGARPDWVVNHVFDLFDQLGATDEQLDFPIIYASALQGYAKHQLSDQETTLTPLFETIIQHVSPPKADLDGPLQMQISALDYSSYVGVIGIGRITRGTIKRNQMLTIVQADGQQRRAKVLQVLGYLGLERHEVEQAQAGDIVAVSGLGELHISDTLCDPTCPDALTPLEVDEPTVSMYFLVNTSPFSGRDGKFLTSRNILERLQQEALHNVALRVTGTDDPDKFHVAGRGELHLSVLIETMRREGYELAVSRPEVIIKEIEGKPCEPYELLTVDVPQQHQGKVMEALGERRGQLLNMQPDQQHRVRLDYKIPSRGLMGFRNDFLSMTAGEGIMHHVFDAYGPFVAEAIAPRTNGVMIANCKGVANGYALFNLQERGALFVKPQDEVYEGMLVGLHARGNDIVVNVTKTKQLTNIRAAGSDENIILTPARKFSLEQALEFIADDELVEVTPHAIRLRKKLLLEHERKRASRKEKPA